ncbi:MAG: GNAT family N-acetyltransferase [Candidatus Thorarchaeota archaeon]|nr:GNAT family N-acetyltransferase [Candidatus Thorarchaeota archaeon]
MELLASRCWPPREIVNFKGWIIHWNDGVTWRANSVLPNNWDSKIGVEDVIDYVIDLYREKNTAPAFKISPASQPKGLDELLEEKGFEQRMVTHVQTAAIEEISCLSPRLPVDLFKVTDESLDTLMYRSERERKAIEVRREIIHHIVGDKNIARVMMHGNIAGVGLGVVEGDWLGLFSIRTLPDYQRRGVAWSMNCALALWGEDHGAKQAFLQIEAENKPALELYESMGFKTMYTYWYRILR